MNLDQIVENLLDWLGVESASDQRLRRYAERAAERYESEAITDATGKRWGRHGEEISA